MNPGARPPRGSGSHPRAQLVDPVAALPAPAARTPSAPTAPSSPPPGPGGLNRHAEINEAGVATVLKLRSKYAEPKKTLTDPHKYYDMSYYKKATGMK